MWTRTKFCKLFKICRPYFIFTIYFREIQRIAPATPTPKFDFKPVKFKDQTILDDLKSISDLPEDHPARLYVVKRKIPEKYFDILYLCNKFMTLVNKVKPNTYKVIKDHPRLIIPFFDTTGKLFAFQGRALKEQPKYLTVKLDEKKQKIFEALNESTLRNRLRSLKPRLIVFFY